MSKDEYLITDAPLKALTVFAMPMILGSFFQQVYNMADSIIVGQFVGSSALAAVGACAALTNVFICVALGAGVGAGVLVSRYFGAKNYGKMKTIVSTSLLSFLVLSVVLGVFGFSFSRAMMSGLQTPADILEDAVLYLCVYFVGFPFLFMYNILSTMFTSIGESRIPLGLLIFSSILNIFMDLWMVAGLGLGVFCAVRQDAFSHRNHWINFHAISSRTAAQNMVYYWLNLLRCAVQRCSTVYGTGSGNMLKKFGAVCLAAVLLLTGCSLRPQENGSKGQSISRPAVESAELQFTHPAAGDTVAVFDTSAGVFRAVLFPEKAPQACDNFIGLVQQGYYNCLTVSRVENQFVVEAGQGADGKGSTIWKGSRYPVEASDSLHHYAGALCMGVDASGACASVFYVVESLPGDQSVTQELTDQMNAAGYRAEVVSAYQTAGGAPYLDYTDTVFGQVYEGMDIVDTIAQTAVDENQKPTTDITINSVSIETYQ